MANIKANIKSKKQDDKIRKNSKSQLTAVKTALKKANTTKNVADVNKVNQSVDSLSSKKIIHKNKASRIKSRLAKQAKTK